MNKNKANTILCIGGISYLIPNTFLPTNIEQIIEKTPYLDNFAFDIIQPDFLPPSGYRFNNTVDRIKCIISSIQPNDLEYQKYTNRFKKLIDTPSTYFKPNLCGYPWIKNQIFDLNNHDTKKNQENIPIDWIGKIQNEDNNYINYVYIISNFSEANICEVLYENKKYNYVLQFWFKHKYLNDWQNILQKLDETVGNWHKYTIQADYVYGIIDHSM